MMWRKNQQSQKSDDNISKMMTEKKKKDKPLPTPSPSSSIFSFSSWLSKLKKNTTTKNNPPSPPTTQRGTGPLPKPLFSPPPLNSKSERIIPSFSSSAAVDDDTSHRIPILTRHHSAAGDLALHLVRPNPPAAPDPALPRLRRESRRRRADRGMLEEIQLNRNPINLKPIVTGNRTEESRRSIKIGRRSLSGKVQPRVRVCSPRLARKRGGEEERKYCPSSSSSSNSSSTSLERFAVVKRSSDPRKDFRDSMVEMIWEKGIQRPEELEGLLACYLELNSDEHHDVIVKVFRQVWFNLNRNANRLRMPV